MGFVAREMDRLSRALSAHPDDPRRPELYAARQALAWALEPTSALAPTTYFTSSAEGAAGCSAVCHLARLSDGAGQT